MEGSDEMSDILNYFAWYQWGFIGIAGLMFGSLLGCIVAYRGKPNEHSSLEEWREYERKHIPDYVEFCKKREEKAKAYE